MLHKTDAGEGLSIREGVGAYRQADLEAMDAGQLRLVADWARTRWVAHEDGHPDREIYSDPCRECEYYELLVGAAEELARRTGHTEDQ